MSWARRQQTFYLGLLGGIAALAVLGLLLALLAERPTCADGKQNRDETGVDCGGSCASLCPADVRPPAVLWSRALPVAPSLYHLVAYVENPNPAGTSAAPYSFKVFDGKNILIAERRGTAYLLPGTVNPIIEVGVATGERVPARTFFEFTDAARFTKPARELPRLLARGIVLVDGAAPRVEAELANESLRDAEEVEAVAILYDEAGNAVAASRTMIDRVRRSSFVPIVFTWPEPLPAPVARVEIVPRARFD